MNETGATVLLRGRGSGYSDEGQGEGAYVLIKMQLFSHAP